MSTKIKAKSKELKEDQNPLDNLEETINKLNEKVKRLVKKNGFSKNLKKKAEFEL